MLFRSPVGTVIGGLAGKAIESLADAFGVPATPQAVQEAVQTRTDAGMVIARVEADLPALLPLWTAQLAMAQQAQTAEIEQGFSSWNWRRNFAHYTTWGLTGIVGGLAAGAAFTGGPGMAALTGLFGTAVSLTMAWMAVNSGGKALADFAEKWKRP